MAKYTIMKIFAIRTKNKLMPHILMHCCAIGKITNQPIYMRTPFIFPYGTMIEWVTIFNSKKESLYSFNYDFEHTFFITNSTSIGLFSKVTSGKELLSKSVIYHLDHTLYSSTHVGFSPCRVNLVPLRSLAIQSFILFLQILFKFYNSLIHIFIINKRTFRGQPI